MQSDSHIAWPGFPQAHRLVWKVTGLLLLIGLQASSPVAGEQVREEAPAKENVEPDQTEAPAGGTGENVVEADAKTVSSG